MCDKELYKENFKTQQKDTERGLNKWKDTPFSCIRLYDIIKMSVLPN